MIDNKDKQILNMLQDNCRMSNAEIARRMNMAPSAILERVRNGNFSMYVGTHRSPVRYRGSK